MFSEFTKKPAATTSEINEFLGSIEFPLPDGLLDFYRETNGAEIFDSEGNFFRIWPVTELIRKNFNYRVDEFGPDFFIFGTDGGGMAFGINKTTGWIHELDFCSLSDGGELKGKTLDEFFASGGSSKIR